MKLLLQRVKNAELRVDGAVVSQIGKGMCVFCGVEKDCDENTLGKLASKLALIRIFEDENGKTNKSVLDIGGEILLISQFTLLADCSRGTRPDFLNAEKPDRAKELYLKFGELLEKANVPVKYGVFGADMQITQLNDGPFSIII
ncbi:MAG: D-tyrosyl-tRNA(Tyr) deacylase [Christensenellaceae bacterium]|jgi:D-tyrosyl-tRNA(Tyr) deacylase|nr:D-tyrosyl-tRNA(Tyr) deacylase [Christensenellaceae bacterium]